MKQKVLILEDEPDILELIRDVVEITLPKVEAIPCSTLQKAKKVLAEHDDLVLMICDQNLPDGKGHELYQWSKDNNRNIPFILCSSEPIEKIPQLSSEPLFGIVTKPEVLDTLEMTLERFRQLRPVPLPIPNFSRIRSESLLKTQPLPCDVFIQLTEEKFIKILPKDSVFDNQDLSNYARKNVHYLFVQREDQKILLRNIASTILSLLSAKNVDDKTFQNTLKAAFSSVQGAIGVIGFSKEAQEVARNFSELAVKTIQQNKDLQNYLAKLELNPEHYLSSHSITLSFVASALATKVTWASDSIYQKLSLAAFLHDIIIENQALAAIQTLQELEENRHAFSPSELERFQAYPGAAAALVSGMSDIPPDVDNIILQHHERPDGSGFPHSLTAQRISPLSALFIIAHEMTSQFIRSGGTMTSEQFFELNRDRFATGSFKTVMCDIDPKT